MEFILKNKVIVITGAADGIGLDIADKYLEKEIKVAILLDLNEKKGHEAVANLNSKYGDKKAVFLKCDVTTDLEETFKEIIDKYENVDVLVNNAGIVNESSARDTININLVALIEWSMKFWEHMRTDKGGKGGTIVNMASVYGHRVDPFVLFYKASKFGVMGFSKSLGHEYHYKKTGVRVLVICPGFTKTQLTENITLPDPELLADFVEFTESSLWQEVGAVGKTAVEVFETAESGTAWVIEGGKLFEQI